MDEIGPTWVASFSSRNPRTQMTPERKTEILNFLQGDYLSLTLFATQAIQELLEENKILSRQLSAEKECTAQYLLELEAEKYHSDENVPCPICTHLMYIQADEMLGEAHKREEALQNEIEVLTRLLGK